MNNIDAAIALLSEKSCKDCMHCKQQFFPSSEEEMREMFETKKQYWVCKSSFFRKKEKVEFVCNKFMYKYSLKNRVICNLRFAVPFLIILYSINIFLLNTNKWWQILLDFCVIIFNIVFSFYSNKKYIKNFEQI